MSERKAEKRPITPGKIKAARRVVGWTVVSACFDYQRFGTCEDHCCCSNSNSELDQSPE